MTRFQNGRRLANRTLIAVATACLALVAGCGRGAEKSAPAAPKKEAARPRAATDYKLVGIVRAVDSKAGSVTIRHEAIPGFMKAMTMPFTVKNQDLLDDVRPGDEVEGTLRVEREGKDVVDFELTDLVVARPAPTQGLTLNLSGGEATLSPASRVLRPGEMVPDFTMTDQDGTTHALSDFRGKVVALTFIYTRCPLPEFCPRMDKTFSALAEAVAAVPERAEEIRLLSVSFDPENDTPAVLAEHARTRGAKPPLWTFAVASHAELAKVARPLGLSYGPGKDEVIHNLVIAVIDPDGRLARLETGTAARTWEQTDLLKSMYSCLPLTKK